MSHCLCESRSSRAAATALLTAFITLAAHQALAQIQSVTVSKGVEYVQTGPVRVDPAPIRNGYGFGADVNGIPGGPSIGGIPVPILTG